MIIINATAARNSGSLSIFKQFVFHLSYHVENDQYVVFVDPTFIAPNISNVRFVSIDTTSWLRRIKWDYSGLKQWLKINNITPEVIVSLQNTGVGYDVPQLIYYHQPMPLVKNRWNPFIKKERILFFYKYMYSWFVKRNITNKTHIVVQIPSIKDAFILKFKIKTSQISILKPDIKIIDYEIIPLLDFKDDKIHFIYPATPLVYKNHIEIVYALSRLKTMRKSIIEKIRIHFTFTEGADEYLVKHIIKFGLAKNFVFEGTLPFDKLLSFYKSCDALLFPSYIETFGLPLIEAANAGLPIIVSDCPYSRDVIGEYKGSTFVELHNIDEWAKAIMSIAENSRKFEPLISNEESSWGQFFEIIKSLK